MSGFQVAISKFQDSNQDPGQGFKLQFPSFKIHTKIQVRVSSCNFQVSSFKPRSRSGFQVAISKFQVSHQDPGQGFKLQFPSFKFQTKIQAWLPCWIVLQQISMRNESSPIKKLCKSPRGCIGSDSQKIRMNSIISHPPLCAQHVLFSHATTFCRVPTQPYFVKLFSQSLRHCVTHFDHC